MPFVQNSSTASFKMYLLHLSLVILSITTASSDCHVSGNSALTCVGNYFVPEFPNDTLSITFLDLKVTSLNNNTFRNLTHLPSLRILALKDTWISNSTTGVFSDLRYLKRLSLIKNQFRTSNELKTLLFGLPMKLNSLKIFYFDLELADNTIFDGLKNTNIKKISLNACNFKEFDGNYFRGILQLEFLVINQCSVTKIKSWGHMRNLKFLDFFNNKVSSLLTFKNSSGFLFYPKLEKIFLELSKISVLSRGMFIGLNNLKTVGIILGDNGLVKYNTFNKMKYLTHISLEYRNLKQLRFERDVFKIESLVSVQLKNMHILVNNAHPFYLFQGCPNLINLNLLNITSFFDIDHLLKPLSNLTNLELYGHGIREVPRAVCNLNYLKSLSIEYTSINKWNEKNCSVMRSLSELKFRSNNVRYINTELFSIDLFDNKNLSIDFTKNPFDCSCQALWFLQWGKKNLNRLENYWGYRCFSPSVLRHEHLFDFKISSEYCNSRNKKKVVAFISISLAVLAIIFVIICMISYTKRWSIYFCIHKYVAKRRKYKPLLNNDQHKYDAFICYGKADINWVLTKLLPVVEEENHYHLCLHDRDFLPGNYIVDNIVDSMQQSRRVVLVLSNDFAQSSWCQFEATIAKQKILEDHYDIVIPILLNEIDSNYLTKTLSVLLKQKTYLEWPKESQYEEMFWERFLCRLNESLEYNEF